MMIIGYMIDRFIDIDMILILIIGYYPMAIFQ